MAYDELQLVRCKFQMISRKKCKIKFEPFLQNNREEGWSPGLVVMGGDSHSKGRGFESWRWILDGHDIFSH